VEVGSSGDEEGDFRYQHSSRLQHGTDSEGSDQSLPQLHQEHCLKGTAMKSVQEFMKELEYEEVNNNLNERYIGMDVGTMLSHLVSDDSAKQEK
jgi:hypothetical protein